MYAIHPISSPAFSQRNQYRTQWRSNKARADLLQLYRLDGAWRDGLTG